MQATWTKLRSGAYGLRVTGFDVTPQPFMRVVVTRRDGNESVETIARVLWANSEVAICSIGKREARPARLRTPSEQGVRVHRDDVAYQDSVRDPGEDAADRWDESHGDSSLMALAERFDR